MSTTRRRSGGATTTTGATRARLSTRGDGRLLGDPLAGTGVDPDDVLVLVQAGLAEHHCRTGEWDAALAAAATGVAVATQTGRSAGLVACAGVAALIHAHRNELPDAERLLDIAQRELERTGIQAGVERVLLAAAQVAESRAGTEGQLIALRDGWTFLSCSPQLQVALAPELVRVALEHDAELAHAVADAVASLGDERALLCQGLVAGDADMVGRAVDGFRARNRLHDLAVAREAQAAVLARAGDLAAARGIFEDALELYGHLGARRDIAKALCVMRRHGIRRGSRAQHRTELKGWESLTAMERDVAQLAVEALTNREIGERLFISRRTVQTHLSRAFAKLDVSSRVELAAAFVRAGD